MDESIRNSHEPVELTEEELMEVSGGYSVKEQYQKYQADGGELDFISWFCGAMQRACDMWRSGS